MTNKILKDILRRREPKKFFQSCNKILRLTYNKQEKNFNTLQKETD